MKKRTKVIMALAAACAGTLVLGACSTEDPYKQYREEGYVYTVIFDSNGGMLASNSNTQVKFFMQESDVEEGHKIYAPDDTIALGNDFTTCSWTGHFLSGWYKKSEERKDADGNPVDDFGAVCKEVQVTEEDENGNEQPVLDDLGNPVTELISENGKGPGHIYSEEWDFSKKLTKSDFNVDSDGDGENDTLLLYAGWFTNYEYLIHWNTPSESGDITIEFDPTLDAAKAEFSVPNWGSEEDQNVKMIYPNTFLSLTGKTFSALYEDAAKTKKVETFTHEGKVVDGKCENGLKVYYADYLDGEWFHVYRPEDLTGNMVMSGCYEIYEDLDFSETRWSYSGSFQGEIHGNGHTLSNISAVNAGTNDEVGGLFGRILEGALFEDITFENLTFSLQKGSIRGTALFGAFAGEVSEDATFKDVRVTGTFKIGCETTAYPPFCKQTEYHYHVGILSGNGVAESKIDFEIELEGVGDIVPTLDADGVTVHIN